MGIAPLVDTSTRVIGKPLVYPNPFRRSQGTEIGYELSRDMDIEIHIYNMFGHLVEKIYAMEGDVGGSDGFNRVEFAGQDASGRDLSAGAYFYLIINGSDVLGKGKMAVLP